MMLIGNEPDFAVVATGKCATCKRDVVELREGGFCADLGRCALAVMGAPDEMLRAEIPAGEMWVVSP